MSGNVEVTGISWPRFVGHVLGVGVWLFTRPRATRRGEAWRVAALTRLLVATLRQGTTTAPSAQGRAFRESSPPRETARAEATRRGMTGDAQIRRRERRLARRHMIEVAAFWDTPTPDIWPTKAGQLIPVTSTLPDIVNEHGNSQ